ncbi:MAG: shikimate dehydrogenase [Alphaproteobacteria bacterium]
MTIKACVIGWPVEHSRSPLIHGYWLDKHAIDGSYSRQGVAPDDFDDFVRAMPEHGFAGGNVTVPHKEAALKCAEVADEAAREIGAANTLWFEEGKLHASNTDAYGFLANLDEGAPGWDEAKPIAMVLGAGGASRAILHALLSRGVSEIRLLNRTFSRAQELAAHFGGQVLVEDWETRDIQLVGCGLLVNTTTLGMTGEAPLEIDLAGLSEDVVVTDLVYTPLQTQLLRSAKDKGLRCVDGLGMLLHQAVPGFEKWFGVRPTVTPELRALITADIEDS